MQAMMYKSKEKATRIESWLKTRSLACCRPDAEPSIVVVRVKANEEELKPHFADEAK
jgi:hypothetical protein